MGVDVFPGLDWVPAVGLSSVLYPSLKGIYLHTYLKGNWLVHTNTPHVPRLAMHTPTQMSHTSTHTTHTHQHTPITSHVPWIHTSCNAWRSLPPVLTSYALVRLLTLVCQTTVSLSLHKVPLLMPLAGRNREAQECVPKWTKLSHKGSVTYYNSFFLAINQACSW